MIFASIRNQDRHLRVLVEDLLDATVVDTLPRVLLTCGAIVGFFGIAEIFRVRDVVRGVQVGIPAGRRGGIVLVQGYRESEDITATDRRELTRGECGGVQGVRQVGLVLVECPVGVVVLVVPHGEASGGIRQRMEPSEEKVGKLCLGICGGLNVTDCGGREGPVMKWISVHHELSRCLEVW